jgi:uncharacterized protein (DUF2267 family)
MSTTGREVFDRTMHTPNVWLHEIVEDLGPDRSHAWHALGAVLRCLRDQLPAARCEVREKAGKVTLR